MNPLSELLQNLIAGGGSSTDWLWCIDENSLSRHIATRQPMSLHRIHGKQSGADIMEVVGETAIIQVHGVMLKEVSFSDEVSTVAIAEALTAAAANDDIKSVLLDIDSPGGSAAGLVQLADALSETRSKKPVIAQSSGMIASAAFFLAAGADKIFAARGDLIGSIGTRLHVFDFSKLFENIGVKSIPIDTGPLKSAGAFGTEVTEEQQAYLQGIVDGFQADFKSVVMQGRGFDQKQFDAVATGGVMHVAEARKLGLIDGIKTKTESLGSMPRRRSSNARSEVMSKENETNEPQAVTSADLKKKFPKSTADWREEQTESGATLAEAAVAYAQYQEGEADKARAAAKESEEKAEAAEKKALEAASTTMAPKKKGNAHVSSSADGDGDQTDEPTDYRQLALDYQKDHKCRWSEACLAIKRRNPDARAYFGAPPTA